MEPVLVTLTSQNIKAKVREEEQRLKNVANGGSNHASAQSVTVAANNAQRRQLSSNYPKQKKGKCHHRGPKGLWKNECRKRITEERELNNENGPVGNGNVQRCSLSRCDEDGDGAMDGHNDAVPRTRTMGRRGTGLIAKNVDRNGTPPPPPPPPQELRI